MNNKEKIKPPIAIIGIACRFPGGASNPLAFWELLKNKGDAITDIPGDRWDFRRFYDPQTEKPGKMHVKQGGFLKEDISQFDPLFFGISPREAENLDPQQRFLLEVTYEAIEDAGLQLEPLKGSDTGVFIGGFALDHSLLLLSKENRQLLNSLTGVSIMLAMLSNRISYTFDLRGPSASIDTACSSSLVTTHYACQSIWNGDCSLAIAGGVNIILKSELLVALSKGQFISKDGRCKTFDKDASGYVRGEGVGVIILKSYPQAVKDRDHIYALIRAIGVNQDGRTSGITVPNPEAQKSLMKKVYKELDLDVNQIHYVEAHGTGTSVGDRVELEALNEVLSEGRNPGNKCLVGAVKSNIGHLEAASSVASLIKAALCLKNKQVPPNLHFNTLNPNVNFNELCLKIPTSMEALPKNEISYAMVNSFGYGGTNAHAILQEVPFLTKNQEDNTTHVNGKIPFIVPITARNNEALKELSETYHRFLNTNSIYLRDFIYSTCQRRSHHKNRLALVTESKSRLMEQLAAYKKGKLLQGMVATHAQVEKRPKLVFVYMGMGPQSWNMGRELMAAEPLFMKKLEECDRLFSKHSGWSILNELLADEEKSRITENQIAQVSNFIIQIALTELLKTYGIVPDAVMGHSAGEVPAVYASGALSLDESLLVVHHRSRLLQKTAGRGTMLAAAISETQAIDLIGKYKDVSIGAINSPTSVTLSGKEEVLKQIAQVLEKKEIFNRMLKVEVPYHSYIMETIKEELLDSLKGVCPRENQVPIYSTVTGTRFQGSAFNANYWFTNIRQPVRFAKTIETMIRDGYTIFLEVGPHPVLKNSIKECLDHVGQEGYLVQTLNRKEPEVLHFFEGLATLFTLGFDLNWQRISPGGNYIKLPSYPWQRQRYWMESEESQQDRLGLPGNPFLNTKVQVPGSAWEVELNEFFFPFMNDHIVQNTVVLPGAAYAAAGLALSQKIAGSQTTITLEDIEFHQILAIDNSKVQVLHTSLEPRTNRFSIHSRFKEEDAEWKLHASGRILKEPITDHPTQLDINAIKARCTTGISIEELYERLKSAKLEYGPYFKIITGAWKGDKEMTARLVAHKSLAKNPDEYGIHPTILDASFQAMVVLDDSNKEMVPVSIGRLNWFHSPGVECWCFIRIKKITSSSIKGDITICDNKGQTAVEIEDLVCREIVRQDIEKKEISNDWFYDLLWEETEPIPLPGKAAASCHWLFFADESEFSDQLSRRLAAENINCILVTPGDQYKRLSVGHYQIRSDDGKDMQRLVTDVTGTAGIQFPGIFYLWGMKKSQETGEDVRAADVVDLCMPVVNLTQALAKIRPDEDIKIIMLTRGSQIAVPGDRCDGSLTAAPLGGLGLLLRNEFPHIISRTVDLAGKQDWHSHPSTEEIQLLVNELLSDNIDMHVALRGDKRYVKRLKKISRANHDDSDQYKFVSTDVPVELIADPFRGIESMVYREMKSRSPASDEVTIKVYAAGINYKDLLKMVGKISPTVTEGTYSENSLGMEVSGVITEVGQGVTGFKKGDEVVASSHLGNFKSYVTVTVKDFCHHKPKGLSHAEAVILVPFLTVIYGLGVVAQLKKGEKILIHNASGGVGLAAIQYAKWKGAEIFATAGTPKKREYLKSIGIDQVMDSRNLEFARTIKEFTNGYGVDVVISAITGEALYQSFSLLAPYGRYIEIGKRDIVENNPLPMKVFNRNITFASMDLDRILLERKSLVKKMLKDMFVGFEKGYFQPLPTEVFPAGKAVDAFKQLARAKHIGKIVLDFHNQEVKVRVQDEPVIKANATYLITGGTRGLGLEIAKWLSGVGASHIVLISRSGAASKEAQQTIARMEQQGTTVYADSVDVTVEKEVKALVHRITETMPPLTGIFHGAMVLDDGFLVDMTRDKFENVIMPKVAGVLNLHHSTKKLPLDFFISFSSIASIIGNAGQANYIAANAFLDSFSHYRCARGLPATTINIGAVKEVGVLARSHNLTTLLENSGINGLLPQRVIKAIQWVIKQKPVQIGIYDVDWEKFAQRNPGVMNSSLYQQLYQGRQHQEEPGETNTIIHQILSHEENERLQFVEKLVKEELARILKMEPEKIELNTRLNLLGIDSIMAGELARTVIHTFNLEISPVAFLSGPTVRQIAALITKKIPGIEN